MKREQLNQILRDLNKKMVFIVGPRQVGKTWLAQEIAPFYKTPLYLNFDNTLQKEIILNQEWLEETDLLIFDEIHKMNNWKSYIKGVFDTRKKHQHILVTGSARLDAFNQTGDSLAGRFYTHRLFPFSFSDCRHNKLKANIKSTLLNQGGFPEPFLSENDQEANRWRLQYINGLIREDILDFEVVHDLSKINHLIRLLRERVCSPVSFASLARDLEIHAATVKKYIVILESLFIIFRIQPFSKSISRSILKEPKIYFFDTGLVKKESGAQFENLIALHLLQKVTVERDTLGKDVNLHYIRTKEQKEVDFALIKNDKLDLLIECKFKKTEISKDLFYFAEKYKVPGVQLLYNLKDEFQKQNIKVLKAETFL